MVSLFLGSWAAFWFVMVVVPDSNSWIGHVAQHGSDNCIMCLPTMDLYTAVYHCVILSILDVLLLFALVLLFHVAGTAV